MTLSPILTQSELFVSFMVPLLSLSWLDVHLQEQRKSFTKNSSFVCVNMNYTLAGADCAPFLSRIPLEQLFIYFFFYCLTYRWFKYMLEQMPAILLKQTATMYNHIY